jgi:hypothetical protein
MKTKQCIVCGTRNLFFAFAVMFALTFAACDNGDDGSETVYNPAGVWEFTIGQDTATVQIFDDGTWTTSIDDETVGSGTYTRSGNVLTMKTDDGQTVGTATLTSDTSGKLTLNDSTGMAGTYTGTKPPPEKLLDKYRWGSWTESPTTTITHSVDNDGVCTIIIGGTPVENPWEAWQAFAYYPYTTKANTSYIYTFEAWTATGSDERNMNVQYYWGDADHLDLGQDFTFTTEKETYIMYGGAIPRNGVSSLTFRDADQLGTFYVKITSITENPTRLYEPSGEWKFTGKYSGVNFEAYISISKNTWNFRVDKPADSFSPANGTWDRQVNILTLIDDDGQTVGTATLNSNKSGIVTLNDRTDFPGTFNGTKVIW